MVDTLIPARNRAVLPVEPQAKVSFPISLAAFSSDCGGDHWWSAFADHKIISFIKAGFVLLALGIVCEQGAVNDRCSEKCNLNGACASFKFFLMACPQWLTCAPTASP